jgi:hypothetical protein
MGEQRQPNAGDANAIAIQFTAIIVSGATSDAEHLCDVGNPFSDSPRVRPGQPVLESYACI